MKKVYNGDLGVNGARTKFHEHKCAASKVIRVDEHNCMFPYN